MSSNIRLAINELHKAFYAFNGVLFNSELPEPAILIQNKGNKKNVLGWCSVNQIWINSVTQETKYEINIVAEYLNRPMQEVLSTLLHEMIHLHNLVKGIKDVTRNNTYHNKRFKEVAEAHGLVITYNEKIGWSLSELSDETKELIKTFELDEAAFTLARMDFTGDKEKTKKKSSVRKYVCPVCGEIIRATKEVKVICAECNELFVQEGGEEEPGEEEGNSEE